MTGVRCVAPHFVCASGSFPALHTRHPTQPGLRATRLERDTPAQQTEIPIMNTCGSVLVSVISVCDTFVACLSFPGVQRRWRMPHPSEPSRIAARLHESPSEQVRKPREGYSLPSGPLGPWRKELAFLSIGL